MERATSVRILNENVDKLTKYDDMVKAYDELTNEEVIIFYCSISAKIFYHC